MATTTRKRQATIEVNTADLLPNPFQPEGRIDIPEDEVRELGLAILANGYQPPIVRMEEGGGYQVGDGWRRVVAMRWLAANGHPEYAFIRVDVRDISDEQMSAMVIAYNTQRKDLDPLQLARRYKAHMEKFGMTQQDFAGSINKSQGAVANTIRLLELPATPQRLIISQEITPKHGEQLLRLNHNPEMQAKVLQDCIDRDYSVSELANKVTSAIYNASENLDPDNYPKPTFDIEACLKCPSHQKIGTPYSSEKKSWRCLDKTCFEKKTKDTEQARMEQMQAEIAAAKEASGGKKKKGAGILDLDKLGWHDYQELGHDYHKIDNPGECNKCPHQAVGKSKYQSSMKVCTDVECFKGKEKVYQDKQNAKAREEEKQLTERVKAACANLRDESTPFGLIVNYLLSHSRKDTRERFARMYEMKESEISHWFAVNIPANEPEVIIRTAALVLQMERYEGEKGAFRKMLAELEGDSSEIDRELAEHRAKHCKGCRNDDGRCKKLLKRWGEGWHDKCYSYSKKTNEEQDETLEEAEASVDPVQEIPLEEFIESGPRQAADAERTEAEANDERELLGFRFKNCDGCSYADQPKVFTGQSCCNHIATPEIKDGKCLSRKFEPAAAPKTPGRPRKKAIAETSKDPLASLAVRVAPDGDGKHYICLQNHKVPGSTLTECALGLGREMGWGASADGILETLSKMPDSSNKKILVSILEVGHA